MEHGEVGSLVDGVAASEPEGMRYRFDTRVQQHTFSVEIPVKWG